MFPTTRPTGPLSFTLPSETKKLRVSVGRAMAI
jgi:hypothetical protein